MIVREPGPLKILASIDTLQNGYLNNGTYLDAGDALVVQGQFFQIHKVLDEVHTANIIQGEVKNGQLTDVLLLDAQKGADVIQTILHRILALLTLVLALFFLLIALVDIRLINILDDLCSAGSQ